MTQMLKIGLLGPMRVVGSDGRDCTPTKQKARALLAILMSADDGRCSRTWLMDRLWSTSPKAKAQASLRTTLKEIRQALPEADAGALLSDQFTVWLDLSQVTRDDGYQVVSAERQFLQGIDIEDPEFSDWLTIQRSQNEAVSAVPGFGLRIDPPILANGEPDASFADHMVDLMVGKLVEEGFTNIDDRRFGTFGSPSRRARPPSLVLRTWLARQDDKLYIRIALVDVAAEDVLWFRRTACNVSDLNRARSLDLAITLTECVDRVWFERDMALRRRDEQENDSDIIRAAVDDIFALGVGDLARAERELRSVLNGRNSALAGAWLAFLATLRVGQRHVDHTKVVREEASELTARALERDPGNTLVLALAGHVQNYLLGDRNLSAELFAKAFRISPMRALAWDLFSMLQTYGGRPGPGLRSALRARHLAISSPYRYYFDTSCLITASLVGRHGLAIAHGEAALQMRPDFNSALRFMAASYAHSNNLAKATHMRNRLIAVEPSSTIETLRAARYPVLDTSYGPYFIDGLKKAGISESNL